MQIDEPNFPGQFLAEGHSKRISFPPWHLVCPTNFLSIEVKQHTQSEEEMRRETTN